MAKIIETEVVVPPTIQKSKAQTIWTVWVRSNSGKWSAYEDYTNKRDARSSAKGLDEPSCITKTVIPAMEVK